MSHSTYFLEATSKLLQRWRKGEITEEHAVTLIREMLREDL